MSDGIKTGPHYKVFGMEHLTSSEYDVVSIPSYLEKRSIFSEYPFESKMLSGDLAIDIPKTIFKFEYLSGIVKASVGPFVLNQTNAADLMRYCFRQSTYDTDLYAEHSGLGNNGVQIKPKDLTNSWLCIYLMFGPKELVPCYDTLLSLNAPTERNATPTRRISRLPPFRKYQSDDVLLAIDVVLNPGADIDGEYPFGEVSFFGQRSFDGALYFQSKTCPCAYLVQYTGRVDAAKASGMVADTIAAPQHTFLERVILTDLPMRFTDGILSVKQGTTRVTDSSIDGCTTCYGGGCIMCIGCTSPCHDDLQYGSPFEQCSLMRTASLNPFMDVSQPMDPIENLARLSGRETNGRL